MCESRLKQLTMPEPVAIIGGGLTGLSCFNLLTLAGIDCRVFDERDSVPALFSEHKECVELGAFQAEVFDEYATILLSPGVDVRRDCFAVHGDKLLTDIELFARLTDKPVVGVTGSNGKSTVVTLLHQATQEAGLSYSLCGNIGVPVLTALLDDNIVDGYIVELSSYHLERAPSLQLAIGAWLNVSPDHLDRYQSYDDYSATKARIFDCADYIVANADDSRVAEYAKTHEKPRAWFSRNNTTADYYLDAETLFHAEMSLFSMTEFAQIGAHHAENVMAVFAMAEQLGIAYETVAIACRKFKPLASRSVVVGHKDGVTFINDSKGTNIGATVAAISGMSQPIVLIAGGQGKGQDFSALAKAATGKVKAFVLIGEDAEVMQTALSSIAPCSIHADLSDALAKATAVACAGDVVMLSPACASFDMFESYVKRGEIFEALVHEWIEAHTHE